MYIEKVTCGLFLSLPIFLRRALYPTLCIYTERTTPTSSASLFVGNLFRTSRVKDQQTFADDYFKTMRCIKITLKL